MKRYLIAGLISLLLSANANAFTVTTTHSSLIQTTPWSAYFNLTNVYGTLWVSDTTSTGSSIFTAPNGLSMFTVLNKTTGVIKSTFRSCELVVDENGGSFTNIYEGDGIYDPDACDKLQSIATQFRLFMELEHGMPFPATTEDDIDQLNQLMHADLGECKAKAIWYTVGIIGGAVGLGFIPLTGPFVIATITYYAASRIAIIDLEHACGVV